MSYFISDLHMGHKNAMAFDNRPWTDVEKHDAALIENWNNVVNINDDVYLLGDISWHNSTKTIEILQSLSGKKHLIIGNHDWKLLKNKNLRDEFVEICEYKELQIDNKTGIVLCHYPIPCFRNHYHGWYHFYGHVHVGFEYNMMENIKRQMVELYNTPCNMFNVGCMVPYMGYTPRTFEEIIKN